MALISRLLKLAGGWTVVALVYYALWKFPRLEFVGEAVLGLPAWVGLAGTLVWFASLIGGLVLAVWPQRWRPPSAGWLLGAWAGALLFVPFALHYVFETAPQDLAIVFMLLFLVVILGDKFAVLYTERRRRRDRTR